MIFLLLPLVISGPARAEPIIIAGEAIEPGEKKRIQLITSESFAGVLVATPVVAIRGVEAGPVLCVTAGIHGDELIGVEAVRRLAERTEPESLKGALIAIPIANPHGFRRSSRYLPDRRDLNRFFPGRKQGSAASRIAFHIFEGVIRHCEYLVDFHTGSFHRTNTPHLRADLGNPEVARLAEAFRAPIVIHSAGQPGTLRRSAVEAGIPAVTFEAGEPMRFQLENIQAGIAGTERLMAELGMSEPRLSIAATPAFYHSTRWVRVDQGGILLTTATLGQRVTVGDELGTVTDPISNHRSVIQSPFDGRVIGMALNQVVIPGFAAFHVAVAGSTASNSEESEADEELLDGESRPIDFDGEEFRPEE